MNDDLRRRFEELLSGEIQDGVSKDFFGMVDRWIEDGYLTQEEWNVNEMELCALFDDNYFTCTVCDWTMPISEMGEDTDSGEFQCTNCEESE